LIKNTTLIEGHPSISKIEAELKGDILFSENWLLAYEIVKKGWVNPANPNLLNDNLFFKLLKDNNIEFYDDTKQLSIYHAKENINTVLFDNDISQNVDIKEIVKKVVNESNDISLMISRLEI
jgi:hypothetical protein